MSLLLIIDHHSGVPAYRQIMDQVKFQIASGILVAGEELPSTRGLSAELSLNPMTISKAYSLLEREGVLERNRGQPLTVARAAASAADPAARLEPLRAQLGAAATMARQLGISRPEALQLFKSLLDPSNPPSPPNP